MSQSPLGKNPYATPSFDAGQQYSPYGQSTATGLSDRTVRMLSQTRPWVIFFSVLFFLASALILLGACGVFASVGFAPGRGGGADQTARLGFATKAARRSRRASAGSASPRGCGLASPTIVVPHDLAGRPSRSTGLLEPRIGVRLEVSRTPILNRFGRHAVSRTAFG
jgi:hypothetical protein